MGTVLCGIVTGTAVGTVLCGIVTGTTVGTVLCENVTGTVLLGIECCICLRLHAIMQKNVQNIKKNMKMKSSIGTRKITIVKP